MNNIALVYECGHVQEYSRMQMLRGIRYNGKRPVDAYVDETVSEIDRYMLSTVLVPSMNSKEHIKPMYSPIDEYIVVGDKLVEILQSNITKELVYKSGDRQVVYDKLLDMETMSRNEAADKYPEEFI